MSVKQDPVTSDSPDLATAEAQMRRALGLDRGTPRADGSGKDAPAKLNIRPPASGPGERPRQRFAQDGDVPVTLVSRHRTHDSDPGPAKPGAAPGDDRATRERTERLLREALATIHDLRTKQGHAELGRREAAEAAQTAQAALATLRTDYAALEARLTAELAVEREARQAAEAARDQAKQDSEAALTTTPPEPAAKAAKPSAVRAPRKTPAKPREPQPVKWWIKKPAAK